MLEKMLFTGALVRQACSTAPLGSQGVRLRLVHPVVQLDGSSDNAAAWSQLFIYPGETKRLPFQPRRRRNASSFAGIEVPGLARALHLYNGSLARTRYGGYLGAPPRVTDRRKAAATRCL